MDHEIPNDPSARFPTRRQVLLTALTTGMAAAAATCALMAPEDAEPPQGRPLSLENDLRTYVDGFPGNGGYHSPTHTERSALAAAVVSTVRGGFTAADHRLSGLNYRSRTRRLATSRRDVAEIAEVTRSGRGWGRIYVDLSAPPCWSVQVPHPRSDLCTELIGADLFTRVPGGILVVAGARRDAAPGRAADMAHRHKTVFNAVCDALVERRLPAIQVHGFADRSSPGNDVVLSTGPKGDTVTASSAAGLLSGAGFTVCRAWYGGCGQLEGKTNVQARRAADLGVDFLHVENSRTIRARHSARARLVSALADVVMGWAPS